MFWKVTFTSPAGMVAEVLVMGPRENAVRQAARFVPFMTIIASHKVEAYDPTDDPDGAEQLLDDTYGTLCDQCDNNDEVSDAAFKDGINEYDRTWNALNDTIG